MTRPSHDCNVIPALQLYQGSGTIRIQQRDLRDDEAIVQLRFQKHIPAGAHYDRIHRRVLIDGKKSTEFASESQPCQHAPYTTCLERHLQRLVSLPWASTIFVFSRYTAKFKTSRSCVIEHSLSAFSSLETPAACIWQACKRRSNLADLARKLKPLDALDITSQAPISSEYYPGNIHILPG